MRAALALLLFLSTLSIAAGEPPPIEDRNFMVEGARNRDDSALQYNTFYFQGATAHEVAQEWATGSSRHQLGYTIPIFNDERTGLGDVTLSYRYQLVGGDGSRVAVAPRISLLLPTRSAHFGARSSGLQVNVPVSATLTPRLSSHTNVGATWFRDLGERELNLAQSIAFDATDRLALFLDASYTHCGGDDHLFVLRPGAQLTIDGPGGVEVSPGIAFPNGGGVLMYVAFERPFR